MQALVKGLKINYEILGEGLSIILLHGWGGSIESMRKLGSCLEDLGYRAFLVDLPGFGKSDKPGDDYDLTDYAEIVEEFIRKEEINDLFVFGHSFGGSVAIKMAIRKKINIKKLVLCGSSGVRKKTKIKEMISAVASIGKEIFLLPVLRVFYTPLRRFFYYYILGERDYIDSLELVDVFKNVISEDLTSELSSIEVPTLLIWGENDLDTPLHQGEIIRERIRTSRMKVIEGESHDLPIKKPDLITEEMDAFLQEK